MEEFQKSQQETMVEQAKNEEAALEQVQSE